MTNPNLSASDAQKSVQTLLDLSTSLGGSSSVTQVNSFFQWFTLFVNNQLTVQQDVSQHKAKPLKWILTYGPGCRSSQRSELSLDPSGQPRNGIQQSTAPRRIDECLR